MWFTETPWPPIIILSVLAITSASYWLQRGRLRFLVATLFFAAGIVGTYVAERLIITDGERIEAAVFDMADAFDRRDEAGVLRYISPREQKLKELVEWGFTTVTDVDNLNITDVSVDLTSAGQRARSHLRANGRFHVAAYGDVGHKATRWELTWQREGADWRIIDLRRLNVMTGEEIDQRAARE